MSDIEVLEIEIDDTDLIDEPERRVVLQEPEDELASTSNFWRIICRRRLKCRSSISVFTSWTIVRTAAPKITKPKLAPIISPFHVSMNTDLKLTIPHTQLFAVHLCMRTATLAGFADICRKFTVETGSLPESCAASFSSRPPSDFTHQFRISTSTQKKLISSNPSITRPAFMQNAGFTTSATTGCMEGVKSCHLRSTTRTRSFAKLSPKIWPQLTTLTNLLVITFSVDMKLKYEGLKPSKFLRRRSGSPERKGANGNGPNRSPRRDYGILFVVRVLARL